MRGGTGMDDLAQWTDWPVVGKAVGLIAVGAVLVLLAAWFADWMKHRHPVQPSAADTEKPKPCCFGRHDTDDDTDDDAPPRKPCPFGERVIRPARNGPTSIDEAYHSLPAGTPDRQVGAIDMTEFEELLDAADAHPAHYGPPIVPGRDWDQINRYGEVA